MINQKPSQMLRKAWALIDAPEKLARDDFAQTADGVHCSISNPDAACLCSLGAFNKATIGLPLYLTSKAFGYLRNAMKPNVIEFNDAHTWEEVKVAWMKAIALAEEDEAKNEIS